MIDLKELIPWISVASVIIGTFIAVRSFQRQTKALIEKRAEEEKAATEKRIDEEKAAAVREALLKTELERLNASLNAAHDKIRNFEARQQENESNGKEVLGELKHLSGLVEKMDQKMESHLQWHSERPGA